MMGDRTKAWLISLLSADATLIAMFTAGSKSVLAAGQDYPSDEGAYVQIVTQTPAANRGFQRTDVRIYGVIVGEQQCWSVLGAISRAVHKPAGSPGAWGVLPSTVGLVVKSSTEPQVVIAPEQIGNDNSYSGVLAFTVIGRDIASPA